MRSLRSIASICLIGMVLLSIIGCAKQGANPPPQTTEQSANQAETAKEKINQDNYNAPNQKELNNDAGNQFKQADNSLTTTYEKVLSRHKDNTLFLEKLVASQSAWIQFRDAELEAIYPAPNKTIEYGSVFPMAYEMEKTKLTQAREKQVARWLGPSDNDAMTLNGTKQNFSDNVTDELKRADDTLNNTYQQVLNEYKNTNMFIDKLVEAELAWIAFRDAELEAVRLAPNGNAMYGKLYPVAYEVEKTKLTWDRVAQLKEWANGLPEGTVGAGSRKIKMN